MKPLVRILFCSVAGILVLGFGWFVLHPREPSYEGRTLTEWLKADIQFYPEAEPEADRAVRHIGSNAIPTLLAYAATPKDSPLKNRIMKWSDNHPRFRLRVTSQFGQQMLADTGFFILGADAKSAVPELIRLLRNEDGGVKGLAARCLGSIGPAAEPAVPDLINLWQRTLNHGYFSLDAAYALGQIGPAAQAAAPFLKAGLTNNSLFCRIASHAALINIHAISIAPLLEQLKDITNAHWGAAVAVATRSGTNALPAVPLFISFLNGTNVIAQRNLLSILGRLHLDPDASVPAIVPFLGSKDDGLRQNAIDALRSFGKDSRPAVPALLGCLNDSFISVRQSATNALRAIDPEAAAKAGITSFSQLH